MSCVLKYIILLVQIINRPSQFRVQGANGCLACVKHSRDWPQKSLKHVSVLGHVEWVDLFLVTRGLITNNKRMKFKNLLWRSCL